MLLALRHELALARMWTRQRAAIGVCTRAGRLRGRHSPLSWVMSIEPGTSASASVSVHARFADGSLLVQGDRGQLQQVVMNLVLNAVEAMGLVETGGRELLVSTEQTASGVLVAVRDSGPGIDPQHRGRVFESFYTTKINGAGMGLATADP